MKPESIKRRSCKRERCHLIYIFGKVHFITCGVKRFYASSSDLKDVDCDACLAKYQNIRKCLPYFRKYTDREISKLTGLAYSAIYRIRSKLKISSINNRPVAVKKKHIKYESQSGEIWKSLSINSNKEISNFGNVRNILTHVKCSVYLDKRTNSARLESSQSNLGRKVFSLFLGALIKNDIVKYKDGNPLNIHVDNLFIERQPG